MITRIVIKDAATFDASEHVMQDLGKLNFIFGANGSGKTTISRVLKKPENYPSCILSWKENIETERRVYNSDFVEENFVPETGMPGIFTLGKEESDTKQKIKELEEKLKKLEDDKRKIEVMISGEDGSGGKAAELKAFQKNAVDEIWEETQSYRTGSIKGGLAGYLNSKTNFFEMILGECKKNKVTPANYDELEKRATIVFTGNHETLEEFPAVNFSPIESMSNEQILSKKVIGKEDVDIGALIKKLGNSDWVQSGTKYLNDSNGMCPFCQQPLQERFRDQVEEYFDETYSADLLAIDTLKNKYQNESYKLEEQINNILKQNSDKINNDELKQAAIILTGIFKTNHKKLEDKKRTPSISIELEDYQGIPKKIASLISDANKEIKQHNDMVANLINEKKKLKKEICQFVAHQTEAKVDEYRAECQKRKKELLDLQQQNEDRTKEIQREKTELNILQSKLTSVIPMRDQINQQLERFGFSGFRLALGNDEHSYKIVRENGVAAEKTLSEGERNFVVFLYFYALLQGSNDGAGTVRSQIVVIDDPVSSMDSDVLFIVSTLIRKLVWDMEQDNTNIQQLFVATHNLYFHKEVSFLRGLPAGTKGKTRFWVVRKTNGLSTIISYADNPIKSTYETLWASVRSAVQDPSSAEQTSLQNIMRRILEHYFTFYGEIPLNNFYMKFEGDDRPVVKMLLSWLNEGSHSSMDDFYYIPAMSNGIEKNLNIFKSVFVKAGHIAHYNMMMKIKKED
ncbi:AAA family ATPase [Selenomonas sp. TAMA-11512]|uniref:AAA family ATPase n=1 Tax=Selenomonas sp. TAMA-11512 TaxID=3095337 RepID=UPI00308E0D64|nr:AAA family ATPase [Selenomonas sp. TAMA-11512]